MKHADAPLWHVHSNQGLGCLSPWISLFSMSYVATQIRFHMSLLICFVAPLLYHIMRCLLCTVSIVSESLIILSISICCTQGVVCLRSFKGTDTFHLDRVLQKMLLMLHKTNQVPKQILTSTPPPPNYTHIYTHKSAHKAQPKFICNFNQFTNFCSAFMLLSSLSTRPLL